MAAKRERLGLGTDMLVELAHERTSVVVDHHRLFLAEDHVGVHCRVAEG